MMEELSQHNFKLPLRFDDEQPVYDLDLAGEEIPEP